MSRTVIYYASDVHGLRQVLPEIRNAAQFYGAGVLVMGGDILGKAIVFLEEARPGVYTTIQHDRAIELTTNAELVAFEKTAADAGLYPYRCQRGEPAQLRRQAALRIVRATDARALASVDGAGG